MPSEKETLVTKARDIMNGGVECIGMSATLDEAARKMRDLDVGSLPICGDDDRLKGIITDRDIVVKCLAQGRDPQTMKASEMALGTPVFVDADADEAEVLELMETHQIRRLPVIQDRELVGMISEVDLARRLSDEKLAHFVEKVYAAR